MTPWSTARSDSASTTPDSLFCRLCRPSREPWALYRALQPSISPRALRPTTLRTQAPLFLSPVAHKEPGALITASQP